MILPPPSYQGLSCYYGDFHNHCGISYGHGKLEDAFENAKLQLDFASVTGHSSWPDIPPRRGYMESVVDYHVSGFQKLETQFEYFKRITESYNQPPQFVTFLSYEVHSLQDGDYTVVLRDIPDRMYKPSSIGELQAYIRQNNRKGNPCLILPHHIGYKTGYRGINWETFSEEASPLVEIISMHGCAESDDAPFPYLHTMGPRTSRNTMQAGLAKGFHFGVTGSTDHHSAHPGSYGFGKTGVWAESLSRTHIWEAFQHRRTFALSGDRMKLAFSVNDAPMGSVLPPSRNRKAQIFLEGGYAIDFLEILKNNRVVYHRSPWRETDQGKATGNAAFSSHPLGKPYRGKVHIEVGWGEKGVELPWEVSITVEGGTLRSVEPRFHGIDIVDPKDSGRDEYRFSSWNSIPQGVMFRTKTWGNPTSTSSATQGVSLELEGTKETHLRCAVNGRPFSFSIEELLHGSLTEYLGGFLSGAIRIHRFVPEQEYLFSFEWEDPAGEETDSDFYYLRVCQRNGHWGWSSPIRFRKG